MGEVIKSNENVSRIGCNLILFVRTLYHTVFTGIVYFTLLYGLYMTYNISDDILVFTEIQNLKWYTTAYGTNWNYAFQTLFLTMSLVYDVMEWLDQHESRIGQKLKYYRDVIFSGAVIPMTMFISTMFWTVYWIDRELVFPKVYDLVIPWWFNHCVHTNIAIVVAAETVLQERRHPANMKLELSINIFLGVLYAIVYYSIYFFTNRWLYGVFGLMTWWQVCLYQLLIWGSMLFFYFIQFPINRIFHKEKVLDTNNGTEVKNGIGETKNGIGETINGSPLTDKALDSLKLRITTNHVENSNL